MKKQQSAAGLFFSMFLRAMVVMVGIAIIIFGIVIVNKAIKNVKNRDAKTATTVSDNVLTEIEGKDDLLYNSTASASEEETTVEEVVYTSSKDKNILVLNSTDISGLAGRWCETLNNDGYSKTYASDYSTTVTETRVIARNDGDGRDLLIYFDGAIYEVGEVTEGTSEDTSAYDIVVIIGTNDNGQ